MSRKIVIDTYENNTVYSVSIFDSYGTEHHVGYVSAYKIGEIKIDGKPIQEKALDIWNNEIEPKEDLLSNAIGEMIELDKERGIRNTGHLGAHRDGLD